MPLTILAADFLKTGDPRRTWQPGHAPSALQRHGQPLPEGPAEHRNAEYDAWHDWLAHVEAGHFEKVSP